MHKIIADSIEAHGFMATLRWIEDLGTEDYHDAIAAYAIEWSLKN